MKERKLPPHYTGHRGRLRRRFLDSGIKALSDHEVLELLLTYSIPRRDTKPIAKDLLKRFREISGVLNAGVHELKEIDGIGEYSASLIKLVKSLIERYMREKAFHRKKLTTPQSVVDYCRSSMGWLRDEEFRAIYLNNQNEVLAEEVIQVGTVDQAVVYPRKILEFALIHKASSVIVVHNHPGGLLRPSRSDMDLTERLKSSLKEIGVKIHDHFIVTRDGHYSFFENGLL
jgi:DNA repair protein RadC